MTSAARPAAPPSPATLITAAARCWQAARSRGESGQQRLHALLAPLDMGLLAPVLDSLMTLCEAAFGRPLRVGTVRALSHDEGLLLGLIDGSHLRRHCVRCDAGTATALDCAICSTRIMLRLAAADRNKSGI